MNVLAAPIIAVVAGWLWPPPDASYQGAILALAALAPELWRAAGAFSPRLAVRLHRGAGQSVFALAAWAGLLAAGFHRFDPRPAFGTAVLLAALGVFVHAGVHFASPSGLALLGRRRFGLPLFAPQDATLVVLPTLALGLGAGWPDARLPISIATCLLLLYAAGLRMSMRARAEKLGALAFGGASVGTFPTPWSPFRWLCVSSDLRVAVVNAGKKSVGDIRRYEPPTEGEIVATMREAGSIPAKGEGAWIVDLRYAYPWPSVVAGVEVGADGKPRRARLP